MRHTSWAVMARPLRALALSASLALVLAGCVEHGNTRISGRSLGSWIRDLHSNNTARQLQACRVLTEAGPVAAPASRDLVWLMATAKDNNVWYGAEAALGAIGPAAVPAINRGFHDPKQIGRVYPVIERFGSGTELMLPGLLDVVEHGSPPSVSMAEAGLLLVARQGDPAALSAMLSQIGNDRLHEGTRIALGKALASQRFDSLAYALSGLLRSGDQPGRRAALFGLTGLPWPPLPDGVRAEIIAQVDNPDTVCRALAAFALGVAGTTGTGPSSAPALLRLSEDPVPEVRYAALCAIDRYNAGSREPIPGLIDASARLTNDPAVAIFWQQPSNATKYWRYLPYDPAAARRERTALTGS